MTTFTVGKPSPNRNVTESKNASLAMKSRQQVLNEVNKRRTLLQDNSWIKKRPEEENADENYGKVVLNQYKSQDSLHRNVDEKDDQKALLSRYRSDTTLNRISGDADADKVNKLPIFDSRPGNSKGSGMTGNDLSPVKKKRQSWMPPPVSSQKPLTDDSEVHQRTPSTSNKSGGQKMIVYSSDPQISPKLNAVVNDPTRTRQICPRKPSESADDKTITAERTGRQELDNLIEVKAKGNKSDKRERDLDDFIDVNNAAQRNRRSQDLDDLIVTKASTVDPGKKRRQDNMIEVIAKGDNSDKRGRDLDDFIDVKNTAQKNRGKDLDDLIDVKKTAQKNRGKDLDDLIDVKKTAQKNRGKDLDDLIDVKNTAQKNRRSQDLDDFIVTKSSTVEQNIKHFLSEKKKKYYVHQGIRDLLTSGPAAADIPGNQSDKTHSYQATKGSSCSASSPKNIIVYTRTYENSFPRDAYEDSVSGKSIKTVYSTSDRAVIDQEMCTYCRKPLGTDTKMILDALQICCHATCFKCEVCKKPLENLKAGDSIWIYKNTVHCSPCYSDVKASWVY